MVFDIKAALKRVGVNNYDDSYKPKYAIVSFDSERLRNRWLDSLSYNYKSRFDFIKKLTTDEIIRLRSGKIDVVTTHMSEINQFLKNNKDVSVEDKLVDIYDDYHSEKKQCDAGWGDKHNKCKDLPKVKPESTVLEDIAKKYFTEDFIEDFNNCNSDLSSVCFSLAKPFNKEIINKKLECDLYNAGCSMFYRDSDVGNPDEKEKQLLDAVDFIKKTDDEWYQKEPYKTNIKNELKIIVDSLNGEFGKVTVPTCFYNPSTKDIYTANEPKNPLDLLIDFSTADNKARKNFLNLLVKEEEKEMTKEEKEMTKEEKDFTTTEIKNNEGIVVKTICKPNKPLKFDRTSFDTSAALKRAGVNQSKEEIEDIKRKINYSFDALKLNTKEDDVIKNKMLDNVDFIESGTLTNPKPGRNLVDIKEAGKERSDKLDKEFNDACEFFNNTIKPLPSFDIKNKRGMVSVAKGNDQVSEVEIMAASKLPKVEKESVRPIENVETNISNKSIDQTIKEVTVKLKKFTLTVKSAFQELIRKD